MSIQENAPHMIVCMVQLSYVPVYNLTAAPVYSQANKSLTELGPLLEDPTNIEVRNRCPCVVEITIYVVQH